MAELSPAARAVLTAFLDADCTYEASVAAALRAAAVYSYCPVDRKRLTAIADELEAK